DFPPAVLPGRIQIDGLPGPASSCFCRRRHTRNHPNSQLPIPIPIPNSQLPIPIPIPNSQLPIPNSSFQLTPPVAGLRRCSAVVLDVIGLVFALRVVLFLFNCPCPFSGN